MAWQAKVIAQESNIYNGTVTVIVEFADAAAPNTVLANGSFVFPLGFVVADAVREIKALGKKLKASYEASLVQTNYVNQVVSNIT